MKYTTELKLGIAISLLILGFIVGIFIWAGNETERMNDYYQGSVELIDAEFKQEILEGSNEVSAVEFALYWYVRGYNANRDCFGKDTSHILGLTNIFL